MTLKRILASVLLAAMLVGGIVVPGSAEINRSKNPLVDAQTVVRAHPQDDFLNVLLLGIEHGFSGYTPSANKSKAKKGIDLLAYHTDVVMLVSINKTQGKINLVSVPRDTLVYVPGVYGVYKMNDAFNCATTVPEGLRHASDAVSWLMGGIKVDAYVAVDMGAVVALGDAMGGVDFDLDVDYKGNSGRLYTAGKQHLDGQGIMDYVRARKAIDGSDLARTNRGRRMITAIIQKLWGDWDLVNTLWQTANSSKINFFTTIEAGDLAAMYKVVQDLSSKEIGSYVLEGEYGTGTTCGDFQFAITDQANRSKVLKDVFGIDASPLPYTSKKYIKWLYKGNGWVDEKEDMTKNRYYADGFDYVKHLHKGQLVLDYAYSKSSLTGDQKDALSAFEGFYNSYLAAFEAAADKVNNGDSSATISGALQNNFVKSLKSLAEKVGYPDDIFFGHGHFWEQEIGINQYNNIDWR